MRNTILLGAVLAAGMGGAAAASTLEDVRARGTLLCGVNSGLFGFATQDANDHWSGFDVALCRAVAAAVLGDSNKVEFVPTKPTTRFTALAAGDVDLLARNTTWTFGHDVGEKVDFVGVSYYDGQAFLARKQLGVSSVKELEGVSVCFQSGTTNELNLQDYFQANEMSYTPVPVEDSAEARQKYLDGACDVYTSDASGISAIRATFENPDDHVILPEIISKEPLGPLVRHGDNRWGDLVRWVLNALIVAEEMGVTSANVEELSAGTNDPEVNRLLGVEGEFGAMLGLDADWAKRAIQAGGNYGEIFARNIGEDTPVGLARGLNGQWRDGGLLFAPPFR
ncbi:MAG: amino acid ABC transporter substrate-binding protein [Rhodobacterales bacterium]|nr:MAG: amino acid ABC transporter substrate-binding protein [Rhodobacterales bacterium]